jgi:aryl-alcohol dehydrogenase-like predicted oxidoreductase
MEYRQLGQSELKVSVVTLGAWAIGGLFWGGTDEQDSIAAIRKSIELGVTTIDTAPIYGCGRSEEIVGKAIAGRRSKVQLLTKFGLRWDDEGGTFYFDIQDADGREYKVYRQATRKWVIRECEESLRRLRTDYIDLYQHHWPDPKIPVDETFEAVDRLLRDGKILAAGVCNYSPEQMAAARKIVPLVSDQPPYSMVQRDIEKDILPYCRENGMGVVVYSPLQLGLLSGKVTPEREFPATDIRSRSPYFKPENRKRVLEFLDKIRPIAQAHKATVAQVVINWTTHQPGVTAALVGARNPAQAEENAAADGFRLSPEEISRINAELAELKLDL